MVGTRASRCEPWNTSSVKSGGDEVPSCARTMPRDGGIAPSILDLDTMWRRVIGCTLWLILCSRKRILYSFLTF